MILLLLHAGRTTTNRKSVHFLSFTPGHLRRQHLNHSPTPVKTFSGDGRKFQPESGEWCQHYLLSNCTEKEKVGAEGGGGGSCIMRKRWKQHNAWPSCQTVGPGPPRPLPLLLPHLVPQLGRRGLGMNHIWVKVNWALFPFVWMCVGPPTFEAEEAAASQMGGSEEGKPSGDLIVHFLLTHLDDRKVLLLLLLLLLHRLLLLIPPNLWCVLNILEIKETPSWRTIVMHRCPICHPATFKEQRTLFSLFKFYTVNDDTSKYFPLLVKSTKLS